MKDLHGLTEHSIFCRLLAPVLIWESKSRIIVYALKPFSQLMPKNYPTSWQNVLLVFLRRMQLNRINVFHTIKRAYAIRSKVVHGGKGSSKLSEQLKEVSVSCDNILRRILVRILEESSLQKYFQQATSDKEVEEYFVSLVWHG